MNAPPKGAFVSTFGPGQVGGLTAYVRTVIRALGSQVDPRWIARSNEDGHSAADFTHFPPPRSMQAGGVRLDVISARRAVRPALRTMPRPWFLPGGGPIGAAIARAAWTAPVREAARGASFVHYVGTGWEGLGFAVEKAARALDVPFTVCPFLHEGTWGDTDVDRRLYAAADALFVQTHHEEAVLERMGIASDRVHVVGLGPAVEARGDAERFRARHGSSRPSILYVGRRMSGKGYHALRRACGQLLDEGLGVRLISVGPSPEPPYPELPPEADLDLGVCSDEEKADALAAADVLCLPSESESFGLVVVEAWQHRTPVVVGVSPALRELVDDGVDGVHSTAEPARLASDLAAVLRDEQWRRSMGEAGHRKQQARYTWPVIAGRHVEAWRALGVSWS